MSRGWTASFVVLVISLLSLRFVDLDSVGLLKGVNAQAGQQDASKSRTDKAAPGRGHADLDALVNRMGRTPPDWFAQTPLEYPKTLDLSWPEKPEGGWNNQKNVGQYIWDVINPNPSRWRSGTRLMHHLLTLHQDKPDQREKIMLALGRMYHDLLEDYARAAFWYRAVGVEKEPGEYSNSAVILAECYWRLGFEVEARKLLAKTPDSLRHAKLLADMGDTERSVAMSLADADDSPDSAFLHAGDALRLAGRYPEALANYQKIVAIPIPEKNPPGHLLKNRARAQANIDAIKAFELFDLKRVTDGSYSASSQGYEGPVEVAVAVRAGQIESVKVSKHREKQFYSAMTDTPAKIIAKQSVKGVDATSNATITSEAIINATAKALAKYSN